MQGGEEDLGDFFPQKQDPKGREKVGNLKLGCLVKSNWLYAEYRAGQCHEIASPVKFLLSGSATGIGDRISRNVETIDGAK